MKVRDVVDRQGLVCSFEISNALVSRADVEAIIATIPGARILRRPWERVWSDDTCRFLVESSEFEAWEPWGDSDCYLIGSTQDAIPRELRQVRERFELYNPILGHNYAPGIAALVLTLAFSCLLFDLTTPGPAPPRVATIVFAILGCAALGRAFHLRRQVRRFYVRDGA